MPKQTAMPNATMPNLDLGDLDAFAAAAEARSFRRAARARGVSASALSEALRRLEDRLGTRRLHRTTRSVIPTDTGHRLLERLTSALGEVAAAVGQTGDRPTGTLRLNVPTVVARLILPPILSRFLRLHPGTAAEVVADDVFIDVLAAGFDAGVRYDERLERDMIAAPIGPRAARSTLRGRGGAPLLGGARPAGAPAGPVATPLHPPPLRRRRLRPGGSCAAARPSGWRCPAPSSQTPCPSSWRRPSKGWA